MVENPAEKIDECPLIGVVEYCLRTIGTAKTVCYTEKRDVHYLGCLSIEVNGRTVRTFKNVRYIMGVRFSAVSVKRGSIVLV